MSKVLRACPQEKKMYYYVSNFHEWQCLKNSPEGKDLEVFVAIHYC